MNNKVKRVALLGLLTALTLIMGYIESQIPVLISVPGVKLGLSNSVLIYAVFLLGWRDAWLLMLVKVTLSALLFANFSVFWYSLAGGALSLIAMLLCHKANKLGVVAVSVVGAVCHNVGQLAVAYAAGFMPLGVMWYYLAVLTLIAVGTGAVTGIIAGLVMKSVKTAKL